MTEYTKLAVNLNSETADALRWMMQNGDKSATNLVHEALALLYFSKRKKIKGWKLAIFKGNRAREIVMEER